MRGRRTAVILGAGASHCYEDGSGPLPLQKHIVGRLGAMSVSSGDGGPDFVGPAGLAHSRALAKILSDRYELKEDSQPANNRMLFWDKLRERGETLETVYAKLAESFSGEEQWVLDDFAAILRTSVKSPIPSRGPSHVCRHHGKLAAALEPGDYILDFNWDSLMADALLYKCSFWYPRTGFGPWQSSALMAVQTKVFSIPSLVRLLHIHGSVLLYQVLQNRPDSEATPELLYLGPPGFSEMDSLLGLTKYSKDEQCAKYNPSDAEQRAISLGYLYLHGRWLKPLFVPPSLQKDEYRHPYHRVIRTELHTLLPTTEAYIVCGYSFPAADFQHLANMLPPAVMQRDADVMVVDPSCADPVFQDRVKRVFANVGRIDFAHTDFKAFCATLDDEVPKFFAPPA